MTENDISEINIIYDIHEKNNIKIFGSKFVENNKNICAIIINNNEYELSETLDVMSNNNNKLKIRLKGINNVIDMSYMFYGCSSLSSLPDISKWNTNRVRYMSYMFYGCSSLSSLPDISKWNTNNVINVNSMLDGCSSLSSLPDISKWKTDNVEDMNCMFYGCSSLSSLPDISKWNTKNVSSLNYHSLWMLIIIIIT